MQRIDVPTAAAVMPTPAAAGTPGYWQPGNPATSTPATVLDADFFNMVQEELVAIALADGGAALDKTNHGQVLANIRLLISAAIAQNIRPQVRQTVLSAAVDSNGLPNYLSAGSGLSVNIAATATPIVVTAAGGAGSSGPVDRIGYISADTSISGLTDSTTNYLYMDIAANGTVTLGATTLAPVTQFGGTYSTTTGQFTFNIQQMTGKVGNGSTASQTYRYYFGEAVTSGGTVSSVVTYALMGRAQLLSATLTNTTITNLAHNIGFGIVPRISYGLLVTTSTNNWNVGDLIPRWVDGYTGVADSPITVGVDKTNVTVLCAGGNVSIGNKTTGGMNAAAVGNFKLSVSVDRGW